jgi:hypothetical protein
MRIHRPLGRLCVAEEEARCVVPGISCLPLLIRAYRSGNAFVEEMANREIRQLPKNYAILKPHWGVPCRTAS